MEKLKGLVGRLTSPTVSSRLTRKELCLSFSAIHKILVSTRHDNFGNNEKSIRDALKSSILASRIKRLSSTCSFRELGMLAEGYSVSGAQHWDVTDNLITSFHRLRVTKNQETAQLTEIAALLEAACSCSNFFNASLTDIGEDVMCRLSDMASTSELPGSHRFLRALVSYIGAKRFTSLMERIESRGKGRSGWFKKLVDDFSHTLNAGSDIRLQNQLFNRQSFILSISAQENDSIISPQRNRSVIYNWWENSLRGSSKVTLQSLCENIALFVHNGFQDPVLQCFLEDEILSELKASDDMSKLSEVVYRHSNSFPRAYKWIAGQLPPGHAQGNAVQLQQTVFNAFSLVLDGISVDQGVLARIIEDFDNGNSDAKAVAVAVLIASDRLPEGLGLSLSYESASSHSLYGLSAIIFALQFTRSSDILSAGEIAMKKLLELNLKDVTNRELLILTKALSRPLSRFITLTSSMIVAYQSVKDAVVQAWIDKIHESIFSLKEAAEVAVYLRDIDGERCVAQLVVNQIIRSMHLSKECHINESIMALDMLSANDFLPEELLDTFARLFEFYASMAKNSPLSGAEMNAIVKISMSVAALDAPGLYRTGAIIRSLGWNKNNSSALLIASAFLELKEGHYLAVFNILQVLSQKTIEIDNLSSLIHLLYSGRSITPPIKLVTYIESLLEKEISSKEEFEHCLTYATDAGRFLVVKSFSSEASGFPSVLLKLCASALLSLSPELYTDIVDSVSRYTDCEPLTTTLVESLPRMLSRLNANQISRVMFGFGQIPNAGLLLSHQLTGEVASDYVVDNCEIFTSGKDIARMLHGFSQLHITKKSLYRVFSEKLAQRALLETMDQLSVSLVMSALGTAKFLHKELFDKCSRLFVDHSADLTSADLLLSIKAMSRVMLLDNNFYQKMGDEVTKRLGELSLGAQCDLLSAYGSMDTPHHQLAEKASKFIGTHLDQLPDANTACSILLSLCRMRYKISEDSNVARIVDYVSEKIDQLTPQSTSTLCAVLEDANWKDWRIMKALAEHSISLKKEEQLTPECSRAVLDLLARNFVHHPLARNELTPLARIVSKEVVALSEDEALEHQLLVSR